MMTTVVSATPLAHVAGQIANNPAAAMSPFARPIRIVLHS